MNITGTVRSVFRSVFLYLLQVCIAEEEPGQDFYFEESDLALDSIATNATILHE